MMKISAALPMLLLALVLSSCQVPLKKRSVLVIGDSNGAADRGWVYQFQQLRGGGPLVNTALSGNTIGFTDDGNVERNTLENLTPYLRRGYAEMGAIDEILIGLGTNDCKQKFSDRHDQLVANLDTLLDRIARFFGERGQDLPRIVLLTPPPVGEDAQVNGSFQGARACTAAFSDEIRRTAATRGFCLVDWQQRPGDAVLEQSADGIHFDARGYEMLARQIVRSCY
ncbi:SGNH/GDSL hydrolase family protein [Neolewinella litorea]|nr:GDSL-type esterase/lipase family protein [Neolewinella litorea]